MADTLTGKVLSLYAILIVLSRARTRTYKFSKTSITYHFFSNFLRFSIECVLFSCSDRWVIDGAESITIYHPSVCLRGLNVWPNFRFSVWALDAHGLGNDCSRRGTMR